MKNFAVKHPVIFTILLFFAGLILAFVCSIPFSLLGSETATDPGRILAGLILLGVFHYTVKPGSLFKGILLIVPGLLFVVWNVFYNLSGGAQVVTPGLAGIIGGLAPAIFEEAIFRIISLYFLKENGKSDIAALVISSVVFGLVHLTNIAGMDIVNVVVQAGYATVIGLVFGAVYLRSQDAFSIILLHFLIDFSNRFFAGSSTETPVLMIAVFAVLLVLEAAYAFLLVRGTKAKN